MPGSTSAVLAQKLDEDLELIGDLLLLLPNDSEGWRPDWPGNKPFTSLQLVTHLLDSVAAICACLHRLHPLQLQHFDQYRTDFARSGHLPLASAAARFSQWRSFVAEGFALVDDTELAKPIATYFHPDGEAWLSVLLSNWKHTNHHAYQLFQYLKLLGVPVSTKHLYRFVSR